MDSIFAGRKSPVDFTHLRTQHKNHHLKIVNASLFLLLPFPLGEALTSPVQTTDSGNLIPKHNFKKVRWAGRRGSVVER